MAEVCTQAGSTSANSNGLQPGHDIFCTPDNDSFYSNYSYSSLESSEESVRLINILPGPSWAPIECILRKARPLLDLKSQYTALSYCAGDARNTKSIVLNGHEFNVFANLAHALGEIRDFWKRTHGDKPCVVWVDQICIDQRNIKERSHQVGFMRQIYEYAKEVLVCLSTKTINPRGFKWLLRLRETAASDAAVASNVDNIVEKARFNQNLLMLKLFQRLHDEDFVQSWLAFYDVVEAPWWSRAWVFQEFIVASRVRFLFSGEMTTSEMLTINLQTLHFIHHDELIAPEYLERIYRDMLSPPNMPVLLRNLNRIVERIGYSDTRAAIDTAASVFRSRAQWSGSLDLKELLTHSRYCNTTDLRDKVYAFIGLVDPDYGLLPDYSQSLDRVLLETTVKILEREDSLDILCFAIASQRSGTSHLPSWVVDWTCKENSNKVRGCHYSKGPFNDDTDFPRTNAGISIRSRIVGLEHATILQVSGVRIDKLVKQASNRWLVAKQQEQNCTFKTSQGVMLGCSNMLARIDDEVWIVRGSGVPLVLRPHFKEHYSLVCTACFHEGGGPEYFRDILFPILRLCPEDYDDWQIIDLI